MVVVVTSVYETPYPAIESAVSEIDRIYNDLVARRLQGDTEEFAKPPVDLVPTVPAAGWPLL